jgi:hypothetical protein
MTEGEGYGCEWVWLRVGQCGRRKDAQLVGCTQTGLLDATQPWNFYFFVHVKLIHEMLHPSAVCTRNRNA